MISKLAILMEHKFMFDLRKLQKDIQSPCHNSGQPNLCFHSNATWVAKPRIYKSTVKEYYCVWKIKLNCRCFLLRRPIPSNARSCMHMHCFTNISPGNEELPKEKQPKIYNKNFPNSKIRPAQNLKHEFVQERNDRKNQTSRRWNLRKRVFRG